MQEELKTGQDRRAAALRENLRKRKEQAERRRAESDKEKEK
jgi:hypothetical protein